MLIHYVKLCRKLRTAQAQSMILLTWRRYLVTQYIQPTTWQQTLLFDIFFNANEGFAKCCAFSVPHDVLVQLFNIKRIMTSICVRELRTTPSNAFWLYGKSLMNSSSKVQQFIANRKLSYSANSRMKYGESFTELINEFIGISFVLKLFSVSLGG